MTIDYDHIFPIILPKLIFWLKCTILLAVTTSICTNEESE